MNYELGKRNGNELKVNFNIDKDKWKEAIQKSYEKNKKNYKVEGFRKGHVPKSILEKTYGQNIFFEDAFNFILEDTYFDFLKKENLDPVSQPNIALNSISEEGVSYTATITLKPEVILPDELPKIKKVNPKTVEEKDIEEELKSYQEKASSWLEIDNRSAEIGDTVEIDYSGSVNNEKFEGGTAQHQPLELGSGQFIPGFEEQVVGMKIGDLKNINVKFPENYGHETLKGKDAVFVVKLHSIKKKEIPALDDELVKDVSEFNTLKELKDDIKRNLEEKFKKAAEQQTDQSIMDELIKTIKIDLPKVMVDNALNQVIQEISYNMQNQGIKLEDYYKMTGTTEEDIKKQYKENTESRIKTTLIIEEVIKSKNIKIEKETIDKKIEETVKQYNIPKEQLEATELQMRNYLEKDLLFIEAINYLRSKMVD